jgi:ADP-ribose pyrophosphatase
MTLPAWKKIRQVCEIRNPWWTYRKDDLLLPSGKRGEYHYVHVRGSSLIVPVLDDGRFILVNQYRYLCDRESIEFPCGSVKEGSTHEETARHELEEETGYRSSSLSFAGEFNPYNGVTDEICRIYVARGLEAAVSRPDETEEFEYLFPTAREVDDMVASNVIWDGMTMAAWAKIRREFLP